MAVASPVGFNILRSAHDEQGRELFVDNVIHIWHEIYKDFCGPRRPRALGLRYHHAPVIT